MLICLIFEKVGCLRYKFEKGTFSITPTWQLFGIFIQICVFDNYTEFE